MGSVQNLCQGCVAHANIESLPDRQLPTCASLLRLVRSSWQNGHHFETESTATDRWRAARVTRSWVAAAMPGAFDDHGIGGRIQTVRGHRALPVPAAHGGGLLLLAPPAPRDRSRPHAGDPQHRSRLREGVRTGWASRVSARRRLRVDHRLHRPRPALLQPRNRHGQRRLSDGDDVDGRVPAAGIAHRLRDGVPRRLSLGAAAHLPALRARRSLADAVLRLQHAGDLRRGRGDGDLQRLLGAVGRRLGRRRHHREHLARARLPDRHLPAARHEVPVRQGADARRSRTTRACGRRRSR